jgi:hypothetical protein
MKHYPVVDANGHLASNDIWNIPSESEVRGSIKTTGLWSIPVSYRALAMDMHGRVFGMRTMNRIHQSGYDLEGRVNVEGRSYRAFTSTKLFERTDGSLCSVAIIYVCGTPNYQWFDPMAIVDMDARLQYCKDLASQYYYEREGIYASLRDYCRALEYIQTGYADTVPWVGYRETADTLRADLASVMGW